VLSPVTGRAEKGFKASIGPVEMLEESDDLKTIQAPAETKW
jgi:hypothetical protein